MKKTLSNPDHKAEILERLQKLKPNSARQWGKMSAHQMVCHLNDAFKAAIGEKKVAMAGSIFHRVVLKWIALQVPLQWPKGVKTLPEVDQEIGGTKPVEFKQDVKELEQLVERFTRLPPARPRQPHPLFGVMSDREWMRWGYLHTDHHLRQFGV
jgi:hypothetical protein